MDQPPSRPRLFRGPLTIGHVTIVVLLLWAAFAANSRFQTTRDLPFDRDKWLHSTRPKDGVTRFKMRKDVLSRLNAEKPTIDELLQMLGPTDGWPRQPLPGGGMLRYPLGTHPTEFFSLAYGWLLDVSVADGRVIQAQLHRD